MGSTLSFLITIAGVLGTLLKFTPVLVGLIKDGNVFAHEIHQILDEFVSHKQKGAEKVRAVPVKTVTVPAAPSKPASATPNPPPSNPKPDPVQAHKDYMKATLDGPYHGDEAAFEEDLKKLHEIEETGDSTHD